MAIGVSYTGSDGSNSMFDLDGVPGEGTMAAGLLGAQSVRSVLGMGLNAPLVEPPKLPTAGMSEGGDGKVSLRPGDWPGYLEEKISREGGLECVGNQIQVKGFDRGSPDGTVYGSAGGKVGFWDLSKIDSKLAGTSDVIGDIEVELEPETKGPNQKLVMKKKVKTLKMTSGGRIDGIRSDFAENFFEMDIPYSRFGVRAGFEFEEGDNVHPTGIKWLAFGDEFALMSLNGEETIEGNAYGRFSANEEAKKKGEEPPVKVISGGLIGGGKYCVKPTFDEDGILESLMFGTQKQIDEQDDENTKTVFTHVGCPYNEDE